MRQARQPYAWAGLAKGGLSPGRSAKAKQRAGPARGFYWTNC